MAIRIRYKRVKCLVLKNYKETLIKDKMYKLLKCKKIKNKNCKIFYKINSIMKNLIHKILENQ
jgi:hypothetical protein